MIKCYPNNNSKQKINIKLTPKELDIFYKLQSLSIHEVAGALIFNKYGRLQKYNTFLGGNDHMTWGHGHIVGYHTHPYKKFIKLYAPPSYIDYKNRIKPTMFTVKHYDSDTVGIVFDCKGTWTFRLTPTLIDELSKIKNKKKINKIITIVGHNTRILNIRLSQPKHIINYKSNKGKFTKISLKQYIKFMKHILTPNNTKSNLGFIVTFTPKGKEVKIPNVFQCLEKSNSKSRVYNITPKVELKLLKSKYV
jgi:hypothetical protein